MPTDKSEIMTYGVMKGEIPTVIKKDDFLKAISLRFKDGQRFLWVARPIFKKRSNPLNKYYWGVIIDCFIRGKEEMDGYEINTEYVNRQTGEILRIPMNENEKQDFAHKTLKTLFEIKTTTELTNSQEMEFQEYCREYIKFAYNIEVPLPNENLKLL